MIDYTKYLGKRHIYDTFNCITLVKEFYKEELNINIELPEYNKDISWSQQYTYENIDTTLENYGIKIPLTEIKNYDLMVFGSKKRLTHFGIYIHFNRLLHVERNSVSKLEYLNETFFNRLARVYRHYDLV